MERILVVAAHPDDEILGCGASASRFAQDGAQVRTIILGEGITSRDGDSETNMKQALRELHNKAEQASAVLGLAAPRLYNLPDNRFDSVDLLDIVKIVEQEIRSFKPDTIFTHHVGDLNIDHGLTHRAVLTAARPMAGGNVRRVFTFEVPSSTEWAFGMVQGTFTPDTFVDVSGFLEKKLQAMQSYESEIRDFPHPRSAKNIEALAKVRGSAAGYPAAEGFECVFQLL